jgi:hypothetical protein
VDAARGSAPIPPESDLCPIEELNFSKVAIKFSGKLIKDQAFTGWRLLLRQLSDVIGQGRTVTLEFSFGKLLAKEREVRFVFAADLYTAHGLEVPAGAADDIEYKPSATFANVDSSVLQSLSLRGTGVQEQKLAGEVPESRASRTNKQDDSSSMCRNKQDDLCSMESGRLGSSSSKQAAMDGWVYRPEGKADVLTLCRDGLNTGDSKLHAARTDTGTTTRLPTNASQCNASDRGELSSSQQAQRASAYELALHAHISDLEALACKKMREKADMESQLQQNQADDERAAVSRQAQRQELAAALQQQMQEKLRMRMNSTSEECASSLSQCVRTQSDCEPQDHANPVNMLGSLSSACGRRGSLHEARPLLDAVSEAGPGGSASSRSSCPPKSLRDALDEQVEAKRKQQAKMRAMERRFDERVIKADQEELRAFKDFEQQSRASERESLAAAWREDRHIKDMLKAIEGNTGRSVPSSARRSSRGTPRSQFPPGSARGVGPAHSRDSIGAAASLALQIKPVAIA